MLVIIFANAPEIRSFFGLDPAVAAKPAFQTLQPGWTRHENCRFIASEYHDGDSFMAETASGKRIVFRLYFVDTPETDDRFPKRNADQAKFFNVADVKPLGEKARSFTRAFLRGGFTATTRDERARGMSGLPRSYAFIERRGELLSEALLRNGLARPFGRGTDLPDGTPKQIHWNHLNAITP